MPRVIGIDPGTVTIDICGLDDGRVLLDRSLPTASALAHPAIIIELIESARPLDLVAGPSGYGLPNKPARELNDVDIRLASLAARGERGGIGGLNALIRALSRLDVPVVFTPGVIHLSTVPAHRKVNRVDMGTADKVCSAALAVWEQAVRRGCLEAETSFILLELGGAFTAALAVDGGEIVDGLGGSSGPLGVRACGALDAEVAFLAGRIDKDLVFRGGAAAVAGMPGADLETIAATPTPAARLAWQAYLESAVKAVATLMVSVPRPAEIILSGRAARITAVHAELVQQLWHVTSAPVHVLAGFAQVATHAAQGAALLADGLAGGATMPLVKSLHIREASGTVLDHLFVISQADAKARLGIAPVRRSLGGGG